MLLTASQFKDTYNKHSRHLLGHETSDEKIAKTYEGYKAYAYIIKSNNVDLRFTLDKDQHKLKVRCTPA
jgi:hypothetical protein